MSEFATQNCVMGQKNFSDIHCLQMLIWIWIKEISHPSSIFLFSTLFQMKINTHFNDKRDTFITFTGDFFLSYGTRLMWGGNLMIPDDQVVSFFSGDRFTTVKKLKGRYQWLVYCCFLQWSNAWRASNLGHLNAG